jgi:hypothetical protein
MEFEDIVRGGGGNRRCEILETESGMRWNTSQAGCIHREYHIYGALSDAVRGVCKYQSRGVFLSLLQTNKGNPPVTPLNGLKRPQS